MTRVKIYSHLVRKLKYEKTTITTFSNDWIISVKENYDTKINYYSGGEVYDDASDPHEKIYNFSKSFDNEIYTTFDLSNKTSLPTQVATTKLVLVYSPEIRYEYTVAFNVNIAEKSLKHKTKKYGRSWACKARTMPRISTADSGVSSSGTTRVFGKVLKCLKIPRDWLVLGTSFKKA